ncbi:HlyD family secretion protein [Bremerella cremea]|uniref:HlyD family secretion protein n=1 Tax=Bremerella cremea TaxID=1031537 RepID=A0A368KTM6_9BACT|nr:efflux RND transporter periplasmic adaptor subunit [Bremerella cremea]RCS53020.1 HlyD family secretion protein [Bremerella cremea]
MIALFVILYVAGIWLFYIQLKVKPNPINLAVAAVIGFVAVGTIVILWQFSAPTSGQLVVSRYTIQIVPQVQGPIVSLNAKPNEPLKKDKDILFEIQKDLYQIAVRQSEAALGAAKSTVSQSEAAIKVADATVTEAVANAAAIKSELDAKNETNEKSPGAVSKIQIIQLTDKYDAAQATVAKSKATRDESVVALEIAKQNVGQAQANLDKAKFDLSQCTVYAPADGFVTNWQVREGSMAVPLPLSPMGTFIDTSHVDVVAIFSQNVTKNIQPGDPVEFALKAYPGQIITGTVDSIIAATGEGQFVTSGKLVSADSIHSSGKFAVKIKLDDPKLNETIPMGTAGMCSVYTNTGSPFHIISKVTVRIKAWMYYLIPF